MRPLVLPTPHLDLTLEDTAAVLARIEALAARTLPEKSPSTSVLSSCGFENAGEVVDPEDGLVWRWEHAGKAPA